jgi:hypothetical protein
MIQEEVKLGLVRDKMVKDMEARGVNPKYLGEMKKLNIRNILVR